MFLIIGTGIAKVEYSNEKDRSKNKRRFRSYKEKEKKLARIYSVKL